MLQKAQFAGHAAVFLRLNDLDIAIDPWLEGNPATPEGLKNPDKLDLIVLSHGHSDHASDAVRIQQRTGAHLAATYELANIVMELGVPGDKILWMNKGGSVEHRGVQIALTHAYHSSSYDHPTKGPLYAGEPCGVVVRDGQSSVYHAGDTALFSDMSLIAKRYQPQIAFLPIGDLLTMGGEEAADAAMLLGVERAVPIHFKTFPMLAQDAGPFIQGCKGVGIEATELAPGGELKL
jgi:L-ascorbate metabolism protein UlaG (beta-lactamase superfamily)